MLKICFIRGCRIVLMLVVIALTSVVALFAFSPDITFVEAHFENKIGEAFNTNQVDVESVQMRWDSGPVFDVGAVNLTSDSFSLRNSHVTFSYSPLQLFHADIAPVISITGGMIAFNLDAEGTSETSPVNITTKIEDVQIDWIYQQKVQSIYHVNAEISPFASYISLVADGLTVTASLDNDALPKKMVLDIIDTSLLPPSWLAHAQGLDAIALTIERQGKDTWSWQSNISANQGLLAFEEADVRIPFEFFFIQGSVQFEFENKDIRLAAFDAAEIQWKDGKNFGEFEAVWQDGLLHIEALDGSTAAPLLWSWLRPIGDGLFHQWLASMKHGRISHVRASVDLPWKSPLHGAPTLQNLLDMKYHVTARAHDADIALGLEGDYLYHVAADVLVDELHLQAKVSHAVLNDGLGVVAGEYLIHWDTLLMDVKAQGSVDVGRLHSWLDPDSGKELHWGEAPATAKVHLVWDIDEGEPQEVLVHLQPSVNQFWQLTPYNVSIQVSDGVAIWDYNRGLDLKHMQITLPWLQGDFTAFLDKDKNWMLDNAQLNGYAPLAELTDTFILPVVKPQGITKVKLRYDNQTWSGHLDLTANDWDNFAGYDKESITEKLVVPFSGRSLTDELLPIQIDQFSSDHHDFSFDAAIGIGYEVLDFKFRNVDTSAFKGGFDLSMPLDETKAWALEVDADFMDKPVLSRYLRDKNKTDVGHRPWSVEAAIDKVVWENSYAEEVSLSFSSDEKSLGLVKAGRFVSADAELEQVKVDFTLHGLGVYDLHLFEARGAGQLLQASGSVRTQQDGSLRWQGLALMNGEFGTLMKQAELDKLFREGDMGALFLGQGEYKDGEPWWRKMKGGFKLRVNDGRVMEGGTLTRLLAAISIVDLPKYFIFDRGDVVGDGLLYEKLQVEGSFLGNKLHIDELAFLSSALDAGGTGEVDLASGELDIVLVARPWQNIEAFIAGIPGLGRVLTGEDKSLLRKVYRIHGPASDAAVDEIDAVEAGLPSGGYLEDLFTPSKWFEPKKKVESKE